MASFLWRSFPKFGARQQISREVKLFFVVLFSVLEALATLATAQEDTVKHLTVTASLPIGKVGASYDGAASASGGTAPYRYSVTSGALPSGLTLDRDSGAISGVPETAGPFSFRISARDKNGVHGDKRLHLAVQAAAVTVSVSPSSAAVASGGSQQFTAYVTGTSNTGVTWSSTAGTISNTGMFSAPTTEKNISVTITARSVAQPDADGLANVIVGPGTSSGLTINTTSIPGGIQGSSYVADLSASGGTLPYAWSLASGALPRGIALDSSTGAISGTSDASGNFNFTAKVADAGGHAASQALTLTISGTSGNFDGPAELPRTFLQTAMANTPAPGGTILVPAGGNLQAALDAASCGDTIQLQAGATFIGTFNFPGKSCDDAHWIIVRTSAPDGSLPPEGTRMTPCYAGVASLPGRPSYGCSSPTKVLAQILSNGRVGPINLNPGASHYRLLGLEITRPVGHHGIVALITPALAADHIILDRVWVHGTAHDDTRRGIYLSGVTNAAVVDSYFNDFHCTAITGSCSDAQTIAGGSGDIPSGPWKIVNNFLEASGENIEFGGSPGKITAADIEIRRNHMFKPLLWMPQVPGFIGGTSGKPFVVKNHFELKNAKRVLFEANILENNWGGFSQHGYSIVLTPRSFVVNGRSINLCPTCQVTDVTIRYSTLSHVAAGVQIADDKSGNPPVTQALDGERYSIHDITIDDVRAERYKGPGTLMQVFNTWPIHVLNSVLINHVTGFPDPQSHVLTLEDPTSDPKIWGFSFTNNIVATGRYPVWPADGRRNCAASLVPIISIRTCFSKYSFSFNALIATPSAFPPSKWPSGNLFPADAAAVQFVNYHNGIGGNYQLLPTSPYKNAASDGKDLGADVAAIQSAVAGVY